jgi:hypothetical protein
VDVMRNRTLPPPPRPFFRIGKDYFTKYKLRQPDASTVHGIVENVSELLTDPDRGQHLAPSIRQFFEDTDCLTIHIESRWHPMVLPFWVLFRCVLYLVQQLVYPIRYGQALTHVVALDKTRCSGRGIVRTFSDGHPFQTFVYSVSSSERGPITDVDIPLPVSQLLGRMRLYVLNNNHVCWSSTSLAPEPEPELGVWAEIGSFSFRTPLNESFSLWDVSNDDCPKALRSMNPSAVLYGWHTQKFWNFNVVHHKYAFCTRSEGTQGATPNNVP